MFFNSPSEIGTNLTNLASWLQVNEIKWLLLCIMLLLFDLLHC